LARRRASIQQMTCYFVKCTQTRSCFDQKAWSVTQLDTLFHCTKSVHLCVPLHQNLYRCVQLYQNVCLCSIASKSLHLCSIAQKRVFVFHCIKIFTLFFHCTKTCVCVQLYQNVCVCVPLHKNVCLCSIARKRVDLLYWNRTLVHLEKLIFNKNANYKSSNIRVDSKVDPPKASMARVTAP
jgi:hypothetical protein